MAYSKEVWAVAKVLFELGKSLSEISLETGIKDRGSISKRAKKEGWEKKKNQQLKSDIIELDNEISTIEQKKSTLVEKIATLDDFEITILDNVVQDETGNKSLLFSTANLAIIRANQMLSKNAKTIMTKVDIYEDGKKIATEYQEKEVPLSMTDYKDSIELTDKASVTMGINPRFANSQIHLNNQNNNQQNVEVPQFKLTVSPPKQ